MREYYQSGFNLVELMIVIAITSFIVASGIAGYSSLYKSYIFIAGGATLEQDLSYCIFLIKRDLQNAGVFAGFSFHNQSATKVYEVVDTINGCHNKDWCMFQDMAIGVKSYNPGTIIPNADIDSASEILRIQGGSNKVAYFDSATITLPYIRNLRFIVPDNNQVLAMTYMLASANHAYLINLSNLLPNNYLPGIEVRIESANAGLLIEPDQSSLALIPFITKYYFVNSSGLQVVVYDGANLSKPQLVSNLVTNMRFSYKVDHISENNFNHYGQAKNTYTWCDTKQMNNPGNSICYNRWSLITLVKVVIQGRTKGKGGNLPQITMVDSVGWYW